MSVILSTLDGMVITNQQARTLLKELNDWTITRCQYAIQSPAKGDRKLIQCWKPATHHLDYDVMKPDKWFTRRVEKPYYDYCKEHCFTRKMERIEEDRRIEEISEKNRQEAAKLAAKQEAKKNGLNKKKVKK